MGLDMIAYRLYDEDDAEIKTRQVRIDNLEPWLGREGSIPLGDVYALELASFRLGYSGFYHFRCLLIHAFYGGISWAEWWDGDKPHSSFGPFWELINSSDTEGTIGPEVCKKLHDDFESHREIFKLSPETLGWLMAYEGMATLFETAATNNGFVVLC